MRHRLCIYEEYYSFMSFYDIKSEAKSDCSTLENKIRKQYVFMNIESQCHHLDLPYTIYIQW